MANKMTTYRRADGEPIWGEYDFVVNEEFFEDLDEPLEVVKEVWTIESSETVTFKSYWGGDNDEE